MVNPTFSLGHLLLRRPERVPRQPSGVVRRPDPGSAVRSLLALHAVRLLSPGRLPDLPACDRERRVALRVLDPAAREIQPRLGAARPHRVGAGGRSALRESHLYQPVAASRRGVGCLRQRSNRRSRRLRALLQHQQPSEPDRDGDQSAVHAAPGHRQPDVPEPALRSRQCHLDAAGAVRPGQPARAHLQRQRAAGSLGTDRRHYRLRRLARPAPAAQRRRQPRAADRHHRRRPAIHRRRNAADQPVVLDHRAEEQRRRLVVQRLHLRSAPALEPGPFAAVVLHVLEERGHHTGLDLLLRRDQRHHVGAARVRARLQPRTVRLRHPPQLGHELHRGAARAGHDRRGRRDSRRLESLRDLDDAQRQSADRVRDHQSLALAVESVARTRHRSGSARLRARVWSRQRRARPARAVVRPGGLRAPARRHLWQHGPRRLHRAEPAHARRSRCRSRSPGPASAAASKSGSRPSTC